MNRYASLCTEPLINPTRHLIYYLMPVGGDCWRKNVELLCRDIDIFNGRRQITVVTEDGYFNHTYSSPYEVVEEFEKYGVDEHSIDWLFRKNCQAKRETATFGSGIASIMTDDPNHIFFYGHSKGVTHESSRNPSPQIWRDQMYETVLHNYKNAEKCLEKYGAAGSFKYYGQFKYPQNHRWHYSGTFYWIRLASVFNRDWEHVDKIFYGTESWPGYIFQPHEGACLYWDDCKVPYAYTESEWDKSIRQWHRNKDSFVVQDPEEYKEWIISLNKRVKFQGDDLVTIEKDEVNND